MRGAALTKVRLLDVPLAPWRLPEVLVICIKRSIKAGFKGLFYRFGKNRNVVVCKLRSAPTS